jgi:hypothetical protein
MYPILHRGPAALLGGHLGHQIVTNEETLAMVVELAMPSNRSPYIPALEMLVLVFSRSLEASGAWKSTFRLNLGCSFLLRWIIN